MLESDVRGSAGEEIGIHFGTEFLHHVVGLIWKELGFDEFLLEPRFDFFFGQGAVRAACGSSGARNRAGSGALDVLRGQRRGVLGT